MGGAIGAVVAAVIGAIMSSIAAIVNGAGASSYNATQQRNSAKDAASRDLAVQAAEQKRLDAAAAEEIAEADRIASETRPEEEGLDEIKFGTGEDDKKLNKSTDFLIPRGTALGSGDSGRSGLGFKV